MVCFRNFCNFVLFPFNYGFTMNYKEKTLLTVFSYNEKILPLCVHTEKVI